MTVPGNIVVCWRGSTAISKTSEAPASAAAASASPGATNAPPVPASFDSWSADSGVVPAAGVSPARGSAAARGCFAFLGVFSAIRGDCPLQV
ncbi:MAG: hypothetical protein LC795_18155 [Acidobacteria bacterium]|nr:hypothetical protein [Acidobacteriota bacterium]